jgi:hypothetical protein
MPVPWSPYLRNQLRSREARCSPYDWYAVRQDSGSNPSSTC